MGSPGLWCAGSASATGGFKQGLSHIRGSRRDPLYAIWLLDKFIKNDPQRVVAYLNIADANWSAGNKMAAVENYRLYMDMMNSSGKGTKIPAIVTERAR